MTNKMKQYKMPNCKCRSLIRVAFLIVCLSNLSWSSVPEKIRILGIFDQDGDAIHEMGFKAAIDTINANRDMNQDGHITLRGTEIESEILKIPAGDR